MYRNSEPSTPIWRGPWREDEKTLVLDVLNSLQPEDRAAMDRVPLIKVESMPDDTPDPAPQVPPDVPQGPPPAPAETWHTIAHFRYQISTKQFGIAETKEFMISRAALENPRKLLGEQMADARRTIAHEIGHVVEKHLYMAENRKVHEALHKHHKLRKEFEAARRTTDAEQAALAPIQRQLDDLNHKIAAAETARDAAYDKYEAAWRTAQAAINAHNAAADRRNAALATGEKPPAEPWEALQKNVHDTKTTLADLDRMRAGTEKTLGDLIARRDDFHAKKYAPANEKVTGAIRAQNDCHAAAEKQRLAYGAAVRQLASVYSAADRRTHRLRNFVALVTTHDVPPDLTPYAAKEWPDRPQELFAEAYALFVTHPAALTGRFQVVHDYFAGGRHRNDTA
jgi:hypothetical protein